MPTYVCSVDPERLSPERKSRIAQEITRVHHELTGAPGFSIHWRRHARLCVAAVPPHCEMRSRLDSAR